VCEPTIDESAVRAADFVGKAAAGLAGNTSLVMATTARALAYLMRHYGATLRDETLGELADAVLTLLQSQDAALVCICFLFSVFHRSKLLFRIGSRELRLDLRERCWAQDRTLSKLVSNQ
jgi:hypothetical protein